MPTADQEPRVRTTGGRDGSVNQGRRGTDGADSDTIDLLVVEDDPRQAESLAELLSSYGGYRPHVVSSLSLAEESLRSRPADLVLLDLNLPDSRGMETITRIRRVARGAPLVVLSGIHDEQTVIEAAQAGVQDYLVKGSFSGEVVERTLRIALERHRRQEILETTNARLELEVRTDPLTGTLNRRGLEEVLADELARQHRSQGDLLALLIDLDDFKQINERFGHAGGDAVLREAARRIREALRRTDHLARVGGDEFVVVLPDTRPAEGRLLAEKIRLAIADPRIETPSRPVRVTASLGLTPVADDSVENLLVNADLSLSLSKRAGKDRVTSRHRVPGHGDRPLGEIAKSLCGEGKLRALAGPVVRVADGRVVGYEIFTRSAIPGFESPLDFFRVATETQFLSEVDLACFEVCCDALSAVPEGTQVHLNLLPSTAAAVDHERILDLLCLRREERQLYLDLSERQIVGDPGYLEEPVARLREAGVKISIDDAAWSHRTLETLIFLRPDLVKLRPGLIREAEEEGDGGRLRRMIEVVHRLGAVVLSEGVERPEQLELLERLGVELAQGPHWPLRDPSALNG